MNVLEAIQARHSVRDFDSRPVPKDTVMKILDGCHPQPIRRQRPAMGDFCRQRGYDGSDPQGISGTCPGDDRRSRRAGWPGGPGRPRWPRWARRSGRPPARWPGGPPPMPAFIMERMATIRNERMKLLGLDPDDPASFKVFMSWGARLFGAPVMVVICMDKALSSNFDLGTVEPDDLPGSAGFRCGFADRLRFHRPPGCAAQRAGNSGQPEHRDRHWARLCEHPTASSTPTAAPAARSTKWCGKG